LSVAFGATAQPRSLPVAKRYRNDNRRGYGGTAHEILMDIGLGGDWCEVAQVAFEQALWTSLLEQAWRDSLPHVRQRERIQGALAMAVAASVSSACSSEKTQRPFEDVSGGTFLRSCEDGDCDVEVRASGCGDKASVVGGKWLSVCTGESAVYAENCRLVRCETDADCEHFSGYTCRAGVCEDVAFVGPGVALTEDVFAWCFATMTREGACRTASAPARSPLVDAVRAMCPRDALGCDAFPAECAPPCGGPLVEPPECP
jgi:hypothetical protein